MDITQFRLDYPDFKDADVYTDSMCTYWSTLAEKLHSPSVFGNVYTEVIEVYTAHCLTVQESNIQDSQSGNAPGQEAGAVSSKTVGSVSLAYETAATMELDGGWFNLSKYGRQYLQLAKMFGCGGMVSIPRAIDFSVLQGVG